MSAVPEQRMVVLVDDDADLRASLATLPPACLSDGHPTTGEVHPAVEVSPPEAVRRRTVTGQGMAAESLQSTGRRKITYRFRAPMHLLVMHEKGGRRGGETFVEGLPRSKLRSLERK